MNSFYVALGLSRFKKLAYKLPYEKIVSNCQSKAKQKHFLEVLSNIISLDIVFSLKDIPVFSEQEELLQRIEIQVIEIELDKSSDFRSVIDAFETCIPYDTILVFKSKEKYFAHFSSKTVVDKENGGFLRIDTDWIYEEELDLLFSGDAWYYQIKEVEKFDDILNNISILCRFVKSSDGMCLRRIVDMLIIREHKWDEVYIMKMLSVLHDRDEISFIGDWPFVYSGKALLYYNSLNNLFWERVLIDDRYSADQRYIVDGISKEQMGCLWDEFLKREDSRPWDDEDIGDSNNDHDCDEKTEGDNCRLYYYDCYNCEE